MNHWIKQRKIKSLVVWLYGQDDAGNEVLLYAQAFRPEVLNWMIPANATQPAKVYGTLIMLDGQCLWKHPFPGRPVILDKNAVLGVDYSQIRITNVPQGSQP